MTTFFYDRTADVFYLTLGDPQPAISRELDNDILLRVHPESEQVIGLTILNFTQQCSQSLPGLTLPLHLDIVVE